jgi:GT2 family glycosyltransferase
MELSIIIPTYNRPDELNETLTSIIQQVFLPGEVIVVDDSDSEDVKNIIEKRKPDFLENKINLFYIRNDKSRSSAIARNLGVKHSQGSIILFLDDDVALNADYTREILSVFNNFPDAIGVQGHITNVPTVSKIQANLNKIFLLHYNEKNSCKVLKSTNASYPTIVTKISKCEWLAGSNQAYRKTIFKLFQFDENLRRYSLKEDLDFSFRIYKAFRGGLYITPSAKLVHKGADVARTPNELLVHMRYVYSFYIFYKNFESTLINVISFYWCWLGYILLNIISLPFFIFNRKFDSMVKEMLMKSKVFLFCCQNLHSIKNGDLTFFHEKFGINHRRAIPVSCGCQANNHDGRK